MAIQSKEATKLISDHSKSPNQFGFLVELKAINLLGFGTDPVRVPQWSIASQTKSDNPSLVRARKCHFIQRAMVWRSRGPRVDN
jgi:hypothetical protein